MAIFYYDIDIPLPIGYPMPHQYEDPTVFKIKARRFIDNAIAQTKTLVFLPGSNNSSPSIGNTLITQLCNNGYEVITCGWLMYPYTPYRFTYGNDEDPTYATHWIRVAWYAQALIEYCNNVLGKVPVVIGQSRGASAAIAWASGYCTDANVCSIKGMLTVGAAGGGNGNFQYANQLRTVNRLSSLLGLLDNITYKLLLAYGGNDAFAPADFQRRIQMTIPKNGNVFMINPGNTYSHSWMFDPTGAALAVNWCNQINNGLTITLPDGTTPAVAGPIEII